MENQVAKRHALETDEKIISRLLQQVVSELKNRPYVNVYGSPGCGKTSTLAHLEHWFPKVRFLDIRQIYGKAQLDIKGTDVLVLEGYDKVGNCRKGLLSDVAVKIQPAKFIVTSALPIPGCLGVRHPSLGERHALLLRLLQTRIRNWNLNFSDDAKDFLLNEYPWHGEFQELNMFADDCAAHPDRRWTSVRMIESHLFDMQETAGFRAIATFLGQSSVRTTLETRGLQGLRDILEAGILAEYLGQSSLSATAEHLKIHENTLRDRRNRLGTYLSMWERWRNSAGKITG